MFTEKLYKLLMSKRFMVMALTAALSAVNALIPMVNPDVVASLNALAVVIAGVLTILSPTTAFPAAKKK